MWQGVNMMQIMCMSDYSHFIATILPVPLHLLLCRNKTAWQMLTNPEQSKEKWTDKIEVA